MSSSDCKATVWEHNPAPAAHSQIDVELMVKDWWDKKESRCPFMSNIRYNWLNTHPYEHGDWHFLKTRDHFLRSTFSPNILLKRNNWLRNLTPKKKNLKITICHNSRKDFFSRMFNLARFLKADYMSQCGGFPVHGRERVCSSGPLQWAASVSKAQGQQHWDFKSHKGQNHSNSQCV